MSTIKELTDKIEHLVPVNKRTDAHAWASNGNARGYATWALYYARRNMLDSVEFFVNEALILEKEESC